MITRKIISLLTIMLMLAFFAGNASARVFRVDINGDPDTTFQNLDTALATAATWPGTGHIIEIEEGTYTTDHSLSVPGNVAEIKVADGKQGVVFQAPTYQAVDFLDLSGTSGLSISGFKVMDYETAFHGAGIDDLTVINMIFENNGVDGYVSPPDEDGGAIILKDCDNGWFENLEMFDGERGLRLKDDAGDQSDGNTVKGCTAYDNEQYGIGIGWGGGSNNTIEGNTVSGSEDFGIQIRGAAGNGNVIKNNVVFDCIWEGITVSGCTNNLIEGNEVYDCAYQPINPSGGNNWTGLTYAGINVEQATTNGTIRDNISYNNGDGVTGFGIYVQGGWCNIHNNCFFGHPGAQAYDAIGGNWWHDNFYGHYVSVPHTIGGGLCTDGSPKLFDNSPYASTTTWEIYPDLNDTYTVDIKWSKPACDPWDTLGLASYNFTVNYDPTMVEPISQDYYYDYLGPADGSTGAGYTPIGTTSGTITFAAANYVNLGYGDGDLAWITFKAIKVGGTSISVSSLYQDSLNNAITVSSSPLNVTIADTQVPEVVSVDGPSVVSDSASTCYDGNLLELEVDVCVTDNYNLKRIRYSFDGVNWATLVGGLSGTTSYCTPSPVFIDTKTLGEGDQTLYIRAEDNAGNPSADFLFPFKIDRTGPALDNLVLEDADRCAPYAHYTNEATVDVILTNSDGTATKMEFSHGAGWEGPIDVDLTTTYTFPGIGIYTFYARLYDAYGNCGGYLTYVMTYDNTPPSPTPPLVINGGATKTNDVNVTVKPTAYNTGSPHYAVEANVSGDSDSLVCGDPGWTDIASLAPSYLMSYTLSSGDGWKLIYFAERDSAGNIDIDSLVDSIYLDQTPPEFTAFGVEDIYKGTKCADDRWVNIIYDWDDAVHTDVDKICLGIASGVYNDTFDISGVTPPDTVSYQLPNVDGDYTIYGVLVDDVGNTGPEMSDDIRLDRVPPTMDGITLNGGATWETGSWTVTVTVTNPSSDADAIIMGEVSGTYTDTVAFDPGDPEVDYTFVNQTECGWKKVYARLMDCANNASDPERNDDIKFDFTDPVVSSVTIYGTGDGLDSTRTRNVTVDFSYTENCTIDKMMLAEDDQFTVNSTGWIAVNNVGQPFSITDPDDGTKEIWVKVKDKSGRESAPTMDDIYLDETDPEGVAYLWQPSNPDADSGYTNSRSGVQVVIVSSSGDAACIQFRDDALTTSSWICPVPGTYDLWTLPSGQGLKTVEFRLKDLVGNVSGWTAMTIMFDSQAPSEPLAGSGSGTPGGSCLLAWGSVAGAKQYYIRYNYTHQYPTYEDGDPPNPAAGEGHAEGWVSDTTYNFEGPEGVMDIFAFSIWTMDFAGNVSAGCNTDVIATNYILGDFANDGVVEYGADLGDIGASYWTSTGEPGFKDYCDIGPTHDGSRIGLPRPDGTIYFEDFIVAMMNYAIHGDWTTKRNGEYPYIDIPKSRPAGEVNIAAEVPENVKAGEEFTVSIVNDNPSAFMAFHLVFDYDSDRLDIAGIKQGEMFDTDEEVFFFPKADANELTLDGFIFPLAEFEGREMARVTFSAKSDIDAFELTDKVLTVRDRNNKDVPASFTTNVVKSSRPVIPTEFALSQNYPNPFNPVTRINLSLPIACSYRLEIFNIAGQRIESFSGHAEPGIITVTWNADELASGIYFYRLRADKFTATRKMVLLK
jgi:parallel beta-helix repeat protein